MTITNEAQLANSLETLLRVGFDYLGIIDPYDRILVALLRHSLTFREIRGLSLSTCYPVKFHW